MKNNSIIYQIFPRTATKDGTIKAATKLLDHIADLDVDIVYLSPFYEMDDDPRGATVKRQAVWATPKTPIE